MARTTLKPAIRNGLTALILILLAANVAAVVVRYGRNDRTRVSVAPAPSTTVSPRVSPTTETTVTATTVTPTTVTPTTATPTTATPTTVTPVAPASPPGGSPIPAGPADTASPTTSTAPPATTAPGAGTLPATDPGTVQAAPPAPPQHPKTGGHRLSVLALAFIGLGLAGLRLTRRTRSIPMQ